MNRGWNISIAALWLALPRVALGYGSAWDRLPARMATHFNGAGPANGWMSRAVSVISMMVLMGCLLAVFTAVLSRIKRPKVESWILLVGFYVAIGSTWWANESVLKYSLIGQPAEIGPVLIVVLLSVCAGLSALVASQRGFGLGGGAVMAEEVHAAPHWAFIFLLALLIEVAAILSLPNTAVRIGLALSALLFLLVSGALSGFHYAFTSSGLEIRTLGLRLRSIPREHINGLRSRPWESTLRLWHSQRRGSPGLCVGQ
jgi:uncharacterized protein DUF1648